MVTPRVVEETRGIRIVAKGGALLCAAVLLLFHFALPYGDGAAVGFLVALLFLTALAVSG